MKLGLTLGLNNNTAEPAFGERTVLGQTDNSDTINTLYDAATDHTFLVEFTIPSSEALPATTQTLFYYGLNSGLSNYYWMRRDTAGGIQFVVRSQNAAKLNITYNVGDVYPGKIMRLAFTDNADGTQGLYLNGRMIATATGKTIPSYLSAFTRLFIGKAPAVSSDIDGDFVSKVTYYQTGFTRQRMESLTKVSQTELGIETTPVSNSVGLVGTGQSNMTGAEAVVNKTTMPQVALGLLKKIKPLGFVVDFTESWTDKGSDVPLIPYFATTGGASFAGYMGRVGNNLGLALNKTAVVVNAALSSTGMTPYWAAERADQNVGAGATVSTGFLTWAAFENIEHVRSLCGSYYIVDDQGQADAIGGTVKSTYKAYLEARLDYFDYYFPDLASHIMVGLPAWDVAGGASETNWNNMQAARSEVAAARSNCIYIDTSDISVANADGIHYNNAEQEIVGARVAAAITA